MPAQTDGDCATGAREEAAHRSSPGRREQYPGDTPDVPVRMAKTAGPTGGGAGGRRPSGNQLERPLWETACSFLKGQTHTPSPLGCTPRREKRKQPSTQTATPRCAQSGAGDGPAWKRTPPSSARPHSLRLPPQQQTGGPRGSDRHASQPALGWEPPGVQAAVPLRGVVGAAD